MTHKISSDGAAVVAPDVKYITVDDNTPIGVKMEMERQQVQEAKP